MTTNYNDDADAVDGLSNVYIESTLDQLSTTNFIGVYSAENFPFKYLKKNRTQKMNLICNLSPSNKPGTHFIALCCSSNKIKYFDSLGMSPTTSKHVYNSLKKLTKRRHELAEVLPKAIQSDTSSHCGFYCMLYVLLEDDYIKFCQPTGLKRFSINNLDMNDSICVRNLLTVIALCRK